MGEHTARDRARLILRTTRPLLNEVADRAFRIVAVKRQFAEMQPLPHEEKVLRQYVLPILTAYSELILEGEMLLVQREQWERLTGRKHQPGSETDDWDV